jgi:hypothetical protein
MIHCIVLGPAAHAHGLLADWRLYLPGIDKGEEILLIRSAVMFNESLLTNFLYYFHSVFF